MQMLVTGLVAYFTSLVILLVVFYCYERAKTGPLAPRVILIMTQMAAVFALAPATLYVLVRELLRHDR